MKNLSSALLFLFFFWFAACKTEHFKPDFENAGGYVIGKERCNTDSTQDYWLIDLSLFPLPNNYGDSLILDGVNYKHVIKTNGISPQFKYVGAKVDFDFHLISSGVQSSNCNVTGSVTYLLKEMQVLRQSEIR